MSHDRGCPCGNEWQDEYDACTQEHCFRRKSRSPLPKEEMKVPNNRFSTWVLKLCANSPAVYAVKTSGSEMPPLTTVELNGFLVDAAITYSFDEAMVLADTKEERFLLDHGEKTTFGVRLHELEYFALDRSNIKVILV